MLRHTSLDSCVYKYLCKYVQDNHMQFILVLRLLKLVSALCSM